MKYYTSDLHLSHTNIIKYENRPFSSIEEMDNTIIDNINYRLSPDDELYILGDFTLENSPRKIGGLIKRIKCKKHLIIGNHDYFTRNKNLCSLFDSVHHYLEIEDEGRTVILFHYPIQNWNLKRYGSIHLYGHVHSKEELQLKEVNAFNVGVDVNNFMPVIQEKLDGSLIKITKDQEHGLVITSKASFESDQAKMAKEIVEENNYSFKEGWTYHFELIHPDNQIVLSYGDERKLVLLAIIDNRTGKDIDIYSDEFKFEKPKLYNYETLLDVNTLNKDGLHEGVVVNYGSYRLKYKTDEYIRLHRIVTEFSAKRVWEALSNGRRIDRRNIPEEFIKWLDETEEELLAKYNEVFNKIDYAILETENMTNKEIALSDDETVKEVREYIFAIRSGKDFKEKIWKAIKPKGEK